MHGSGAQTLHLLRRGPCYASTSLAVLRLIDLLNNRKKAIPTIEVSLAKGRISDLGILRFGRGVHPKLERASFGLSSLFDFPCLNASKKSLHKGLGIFILVVFSSDCFLPLEGFLTCFP